MEAIVSALVTAIVSIWGSYITLQKNKDNALQKERDRSDLLLEEQRKRYEKYVFEERISAKEEKEFIVNHYETIFKFIKEHYNIDPDKLETDKTEKFSVSQIQRVTEEMKKRFSDSKENFSD